MLIMKKEMVETDIATGYKCDVCENIYDKDLIKDCSQIIFSYPTGVWGERSKTDILDVCSLECLFNGLKKVPFSAKLELSDKFIEELKKVKFTENKKNESGLAVGV